MTTERTGWRDQSLSERHRSWGANCPAVDLDFVLIEFHHARPVALVEYKHRRARPTDPTHPTIRTLVELADGYRHGPLPCAVVRYDSDPWTFEVQPLNAAAEAVFGPTRGRTLTEQEYVRTLYAVRRQALSVADEAAIGRLDAVAIRVVEEP